MVWWRTTIVSIASVVLALAITATVFSAAIAGLTAEESLRPFFTKILADAGESQADAAAKFDEFYFKEFSCGDVPGCIAKPPAEGWALVFMSKTGHDFFKTVPGQGIVAVLLAIVAILMAGETWSGRINSIGIPGIIAGVNMFLKFAAQGPLLKFAPTEAHAYLVPLLDDFFGTLMLWFGITLVVGMVLVVIGFIVRRHESQTLKTVPQESEP
ncbi:hypothetical protein HY493_01060 [Candidatus Woesearchaeota archaeon]|nr:hypothetical protein [Candidatus Woesearchaeota archaeon]